MISAIQPILKPAYTDKGNPYYESNLGRFAANASIAGTTIYYGGKFAIKNANKTIKKAKTIKLDLPKISKLNMKSVKKATKDLSKKIPNNEVIKSFIKNIPTLIKAEYKKVRGLAKQGFEIITKNTKKINKTNLKKVGKEIVKFTKKPSTKYGAGVVAGLAAIIATGYAIDFITNKISARNADKKA